MKTFLEPAAFFYDTIYRVFSTLLLECYSKKTSIKIALFNDTLTLKVPILICKMQF